MSLSEAGPRPPRVGETPTATYRLQLNQAFTFRKAAALIPYLAELGVSHVYASPYLKARPGSTHGYDIIDHNSLNPEYGSAEDFERFVSALREHALGQILDFVPNHMGVMGSDNEWWLDLLENGLGSAYAAYFDVDWEPVKRELHHKILLPVLGDHYGVVLESGDLRLEFDAEAGTFSVYFYEHRFPIDPRAYSGILEDALPALEGLMGAENEDLLDYKSLIAAFEHLPPQARLTEEQIEERHRDKEIHKRRLARLCRRCEPVMEAVRTAAEAYNGTPGQPQSFERLHRLLERQVYRLASWKTASDEINYRRFFDINDLAGIRMENAQVFEATHRLVFQLVAEGKLHGLRLDHPDGLYDPAGYFQQLHERLLETSDAKGPEGAYVIAEKILATYEHLREEWSIEGTTGYETANLINGLFVDSRSEAAMTRNYLRYVREPLEFDQVLYEAKKRIMRSSLSSELQVLATQLNRISESNPKTRDFTLNALRSALLEVVACFPVYRTYVSADSVTEEDRRYVDWAVAQARKRSAMMESSIFDFVQDTLLIQLPEGTSPQQRRAVVRFAMRFQQYTAPVMAKGMEDTTFYIYNRLVSLNEVGGDPRRFGASVAAFHHLNQERAQRWPRTMLSSTTHDAKRSEDVRARINVLSEMPRLWQTLVTRWSRLNRAKKTRTEDRYLPSRNDEYLLYQTLLGVWPLEPPQGDWEELRGRVREYMLKAVKEAKVHTSWINPNPEYEEALSRFVEALLQPREHDLFLESFLPFQRRVARLGMFNSLSQALLKFTSPGVPDVYQGNELWDFSLVDPDNRRPVDYERRRVLLTELKAAMAVSDAELAARVRSLLDSMEDGRIKLYLSWRCLGLRRAQPRLFAEGAYLPLDTAGEFADHLVAFARAHDGVHLLSAAPRLLGSLLGETAEYPLGEIWKDTRLKLPEEAGARFRNRLTGELVHVERLQGEAWLYAGDVFANFPVALLEPSE